MTFTYDMSLLSTDSMTRIRLEIGDTDTNRVLLQDEEINQIIIEQSDFHMQVAECCRLILARIAKEPGKLKIENYFEDITKMGEYYSELAKRHSLLSGSAAPWAGSIDVDYKETMEDDTSKVKPLFKRGIHDN